MSWHLYLVRTRTGVLYTGITTDVDRRLGQHRDGTGAKALRGRGSLELVYSAEVGDRSTALRAELRIKALAKREKERLVRSRPDAESLLSTLFPEFPEFPETPDEIDEVEDAEPSLGPADHRNDAAASNGLTPEPSARSPSAESNDARRETP